MISASKSSDSSADDASDDEESLMEASQDGSPDRVAGRHGRLGVPEAPPEVSVSQLREMHLPQASPPSELDLRRFIRPGDIFNYMGGNAWGHTVLALTLPLAFNVPVLYGSAQPAGKGMMHEFIMTLQKTNEHHLGISIDDKTVPTCLIIKAVSKGGLVDVWNQENPTHLHVRPDDRIISVNDVKGSAETIFAEGMKTGTLQVVIRREQVHMPIAHDVTLYAINVLQSASNEMNIRAAPIVLAVHPETKHVCAAKVTNDGAQICQGHDGPVQVDVLMSSLDNTTLHMDLFRLAVDEVQRAPRNQAWSFRTAIRSYVRPARLRPDKYNTENRKLRLAQKLCEGWQARPVCSTVPPRVWSIYLLKKAYRHLVDHHGVQKQPPLGAAGQALEISWVEDVLRLMPIRDDRVLPEELCSFLAGTTFWKSLDLSRGPPKHRLHDDSASSEATTREQLEQLHWRSCTRQEQALSGIQNRDGAAVHVGSDGFTVYCGAKTPLSSSRFRNPWSNKTLETCGPSDGMQCIACHWLEARLAT